MASLSGEAVRNLAKICIPSMLFAYGIGALERSFANQIRVQKFVLSNLRDSLKDRQDWYSYIKHVYSWSYETLLSIPGINVVICAVSSIFGSPLDRLWAEKKFELLVEILEEQLKEPQGIKWTPPIVPQPIDNTIPMLSRYCRNLTFCAEQGDLLSSNACETQVGLLFLMNGPPGKGKKIIWLPDVTGTLEGTLAGQTVPGGKTVNRFFENKQIFCLDWERLSQQPDPLKLVDQILTETKNQQGRVLLLISNPSLLEQKVIDKIYKALDGTFYVFAIGPSDSKEVLKGSEDKIVTSNSPFMLEQLQSVILETFLPRLERTHHLYIEDQIVKNLFLENSLNPPASHVWIEKIEQLINNHQVTPTPGDKKLSKFLDILIRIRNRVSDKALWNQKIQDTARKFSSALKAKGNPAQVSKTSSGKHRKANDPVSHLNQSTPLEKNKLDSQIPFISSHCKELTSEEKLPPFVGRSKEILQIAEILGRQEKRAPLLIGASGTGKIAILQGIAGQITKNSSDLPSIFRGKKVFVLKDSEIFARAAKGTISAASILAHILQEAERNKGKILLILQNLEGFWGGNDRDKTQMRQLLLSALDNQSIECIATTTPTDYSRMIQEDRALEKQFSPVKIHQPSDKELTEILSVAIPWLAIRHAVGFDDKIGDECVKLARKYLKNAPFPAIVIDILDQTASHYKIQHLPTKEDSALSLKLQSQPDDSRKPAIFSQTIGVDQLYPIFSQKTGLPLEIMNQSNKELLKSLDKKISERIKGQPEAIKSLCDGVRVAKFEAGSGSSMAVFLFLGTTGVGKTETVRILAELLYGSPDKMLRLDMAEYATDIDKTKLIGVAPGYVGHERGGLLTNWLKENPFSIVLFDEIEKAHQEIRQLLLGLFDKGRITDSDQNTIECPDAIFVMTSNLGADEIPKHLNDTAGLKQAIDPILRKAFSPEFLGRVRTTAIFRSLDLENVRQITELRLKEIKEACKTDPRYLGIDVTWTEDVIRFFAESHYDSKKGGRGIETAVKDNIKTVLVNGVIEGKIQKGDKVSFIVKNDTINMQVTR